MKSSFQLLLAGIVLLVLAAANTYAQPVTKISAGLAHSLFIKSDGSLWAMGNDGNGELGDGTNSYSYPGIDHPEQIVAGNVTAIAAAGYSFNFSGFSLFLKDDGSLWAMGNDDFGQLGDGTNNPDFQIHGSGTNLPEMIVSSNVTAIAAAATFSLFLKKDASLWAIGNNNFGQLGDGTYNQTNRPELIVASNVVAIAAGGGGLQGRGHSLFLKSDGSLWAMGNNTFGQLGDGTTDDVNHPEQIVASNVVAIAAGDYHSLFLKNDGSLWGMGLNYSGELGDGTTDALTGNNNYQTNFPEQIIASNVTAIAAGSAHSLFLKNDGSLWGMGNNGAGELGLGSLDNAYLPTQIAAKNVTVISAGYAFSLFIKSDGSLWATGSNLKGQLGNGTFGGPSSYGISQPEQIVAGSTGLAGIGLSGTNLVLNGIYGLSGSTNYVLASTNLALPKNQWTPVSTNVLNTSGNFTLTLTNAVNPSAPQQFYILQSQ